MARVNCDQCSQTFNTKKLFVSHLITKSCHKSIREAAKSQTRNKAQQEENFDYPTLEIVPVQDCPECRRFSKAGMQMYMLSHLASHVQSKAEYFECEDCSLKFESAYYLEKHENKKHKNEKCDDCPKKFKITSLLQKHVEDVHKTENCNDCGYRARTKDMLDTHIYNNHPTDVCEECGMAFENPSVVEKHFREIHEKMKCDDCDQEFDSEEVLDHHKVEVHNHAKTTFKQFGGGLMMMMVSENTEPAEEEKEHEENDLPKSNISSEVNLVEKEKVYASEKKVLGEEIKDEEIVSEKVDVEAEDNVVVEDASTIEVKPEDEVTKIMTPTSNINVFGPGFFMMYQEESEKNQEKNSKEDIPKELQDRSENTPENENEEDAPQKYKEDTSVNKKRCIDNVELDESNEEAKIVKKPKQTIEEADSVLDRQDISTGSSDTSEQIGNSSDPMETCDQSDEGKDDM